jgi:hypothetical protein
MQDSNGTQKDATIILGQEHQLSSGNLAPGGKVTGTLGFEVPKGDAGLKRLFVMKRGEVPLTAP